MERWKKCVSDAGRSVERCKNVCLMQEDLLKGVKCVPDAGGPVERCKHVCMMQEDMWKGVKKCV